MASGPPAEQEQGFDKTGSAAFDISTKALSRSPKTARAIALRRATIITTAQTGARLHHDAGTVTGVTASRAAAA